MIDGANAMPEGIQYIDVGRVAIDAEHFARANRYLNRVAGGRRKLCG